MDEQSNVLLLYFEASRVAPGVPFFRIDTKTLDELMPFERVPPRRLPTAMDKVAPASGWHRSLLPDA